VDLGRSLNLVRVGEFSGAALSLKEALGARVNVWDHDLMSLSRRPSLLRARVKAHAEAIRAKERPPWARTAAWSMGTQRSLTRRGFLLNGAPVLFLQTLPAYVLPPGTRYGVYTDRVGAEGIAQAGPHAPRASSGWREREKLFIQRACRVYVMGETTREFLESDYGLPQSKIRVIGAGPSAPLRGMVHSSNCRTLLFVGIEWHRKGGPDLLEAFGRLRLRHPQVELLLVGSCPSDPLPEGVRPVGRVPRCQMDAVYSQADAVVIPSHIDAFPFSFIEAIMKGLPCVGTSVGNSPSIIGDAGECVERGDIDALAAALDRLVTHYPQYRNRTLHRREVFSKTLTWRTVAEVIIDDLVYGRMKTTPEVDVGRHQVIVESRTRN
jgi:glycosyltransferase involved in cell wall biosynthesis